MAGYLVGTLQFSWSMFWAVAIVTGIFWFSEGLEEMYFEEPWPVSLHIEGETAPPNSHPRLTDKCDGLQDATSQGIYNECSSFSLEILSTRTSVDSSAWLG